MSFLRQWLGGIFESQLIYLITNFRIVVSLFIQAISGLEDLNGGNRIA